MLRIEVAVDLLVQKQPAGDIVNLVAQQRAGQTDDCHAPGSINDIGPGVVRLAGEHGGCFRRAIGPILVERHGAIGVLYAGQFVLKNSAGHSLSIV